MASKAVIDTLIAEAGGEGDEGLIAAAWAIQQRAAANGVTVDQVVKSGFDGYSNPGSGAVKAQQNPALRAKVERIMSQVESGEITNPVPGADHFLSGDVMPSWARGMKLVATIGGHRFYASGQVPEAAQGNAVATQLSVREAPTPATPSPAVVARRNPQNMVPGADLSTQERNAVTPFLTRDGSGVTDPAGIVLGKQMTTKLAPTPGQSIIERIKPAPVNPSRPAITPASTRQAADVRTMRNANQENADAERNRVVVASIPTTAVGGPPTTRRVTSVPVTPRPGQSIIERAPPARVAQVAPGQSIIERSPPASPLAVAGAPAVARATPAIQSAAMLASRTPGRVAPTPATRTAPVVAPRAVTPVAVATQRSVLPPKATPAPATATMLSAAIAAVRQSGDTSSGNQLEAAQARASGAGGRTRRY